MDRPKKYRCPILWPKEGILDTGEWTSVKPEIIEEDCIECGICYSYCPEGAISENLEIDQEYCKGCGICAEECPVGAIKLGPK